MAYKQFYPLKQGQYLSSWDTVSFFLNGSTTPIVGHIQNFNTKTALQGADFIYGSSDGGLPIARKHGKMGLTGTMQVIDSFYFELVENFKSIGFFHTQWDFSITTKDPEGTPKIIELMKCNFTEESTDYKIGEINLVSLSFQGFNKRVNSNELILPVPG